MFVFCYRIILTTYKLCNVRLNKTKHFQYLGIVYWSQLGLFLSLKQQDIALSSRRYKYSALHINHCFYLIFSMDQKWLLSTYTKGIINITTFIKKICDSFTKEKNGFFKIRKKPISSFSRRGNFFFQKCILLPLNWPCKIMGKLFLTYFLQPNGGGQKQIKITW